MVLCFPHVRGTWRAGDARGWAPALTSCACRPRVGPPGYGAASPGPLSEAPCDLGVRTLLSTGELNQTECDKQTCECDRSVALCFRKQIYREEHRNYLNIYCQGPTPSCSVYEPPPVPP